MLRFLAPLLFLLTACASFESGKDIAEADFAWIQAGETTMKEVIARHGKPQMIMATSGGGRRLHYSHTTSTASALNASLLNPFSTEVDSQVDTETCTVLVDAAGVVVDWAYVGPDVE